MAPEKEVDRDPNETQAAADPTATPAGVTITGGDSDYESDEESPDNVAFEPGFAVIRTNKVGIWFGDLQSHEGDTVVIKRARRIWSVDGQELADFASSGPAKGLNYQVMGEKPEVTLNCHQLTQSNLHERHDVSEKVAKAIYALPVHKHPAPAYKPSPAPASKSPKTAPEPLTITEKLKKPRGR